MADLTAKIFPKLKTHRLPGLDLDTEFIYPYYDGYSILNIPSSICQLLGTPEISARPLTPELTGSLGDSIRRVILVLVDALAFQRMQCWMANDIAPIWGQMERQGLFAPLTSITPCTTSAALTSMWTGRSPTEHGIAGYELWLKEYGVVASMIQHSPISFQNDLGSLEKAGFRPTEYLTYPTLGTFLSRHGIKTHAFQPRSILRSGLSRMFLKDVELHGYFTPSDLWANLRQLAESRSTEKQYIWVYWSEIDTFSHFYAPDDERTAAEFSAFSTAFEKLFLAGLSPKTRQETLMIVTADHGQITTYKNADYELRSHPELNRHLHILPTGENRLIYLFARPGQQEAVRGYFQQTWPDLFGFLDPVYALERGLFGPGKPHPRLLERLGDLIVAARDRAYLWWADKDNFLIGRHGGFSPEEMLVPFLAFRL
jgi:hypothetical protein